MSSDRSSSTGNLHQNESPSEHSDTGRTRQGGADVTAQPVGLPFQYSSGAVNNIISQLYDEFGEHQHYSDDNFSDRSPTMMLCLTL